MIADRYPPPEVWLEVDQAARSAEALASAGREVDFRLDDSGRLKITMLDAGVPVRALSALEALAVAGGAPL